MLVSIIVSNYNCKDYLKEAIESLLAQTHQDIEILLFDDASTDGSRNMVKQFGKHPKIRTWLGGKNRGFPTARNFMFRHVRGELVTFLDADDVSKPHRLTKQINHLIDKDLIACGCGMEQFWEGSSKTKIIEPPLNSEAIIERMARKGYGAMYSSTILFRRDLIDVGIRFDETIQTAADTLWQCRFALEFPERLGNIPDALYRYRRHPDQLTHQQRQGKFKHEEARKHVFTNYRKALGRIIGISV